MTKVKIKINNQISITKKESDHRLRRIMTNHQIPMKSVTAISDDLEM